MDKEKADMIIYTTEDGLTKVETTFDGDTVWLSIDQMAELFQRDKSTISRHIKNIESLIGIRDFNFLCEESIYFSNRTAIFIYPLFRLVL